MNNGHMSSFFKPERGVRQGCPLSPTLFVIAIELLAIHMKKDKNLGIKSKEGNNYLISQFANDTSLALLNKRDCLKNAFKNLENFGKISGLKINVDKSEILLLGPSTIWDIPKEYRSIIKDTVYILRIKMCKNKKELVKINYEPIREKNRRSNKKLVKTKVVTSRTNLRDKNHDTLQANILHDSATITGRPVLENYKWINFQIYSQ